MAEECKITLKTLTGMCLLQQKFCDIFSFFEFKVLFYNDNVNQLR